MKNCINCGAQIKEGNFFCPRCGKPIPQDKTCSHCGATINDGDVFCTKCGVKIEESLQAIESDVSQLSTIIDDSIVNNQKSCCESESDRGNCEIHDDIEEAEDEYEVGSSRIKIIIPIIVVVIVLAIVGGWYCLTPSNNQTIESVKDTMPEVPHNEWELGEVNDSDLDDYSDNVDDDESKTPLYTSPMAFHSKESVLSYLANKTFRYNEYSEIRFDESGMVVQRGKEISSVYMLQCSSQSAVIKYTAKDGNVFNYLVQIDENKLQVVDLFTGCMVYHQDIVDEDYSSCPSLYSSTLSFESEEDVIKQLTSRRFRNNQGGEIIFDDEGYRLLYYLIDNTRYIEKCKVTVSSYLSQSAIINTSGLGSMIVQIDNDKIQIVDGANGAVYN